MRWKDFEIAKITLCENKFGKLLNSHFTVKLQ